MIIDDKVDSLGTTGLDDEAKTLRDGGREASSLEGKKSAAHQRLSNLARAREIRAKKRGRPTKKAGLAPEVVDEENDDPELEAARAEFEGALVEIMVAATDGLADARYETLKKKYPDDAARGLADKARLTESEKKYFGALAIRLWRKYLGDKYLFTDESIAALYLARYFLRNLEGITQARKIDKESAEEANATAAKRSQLQSPSSPSPRDNGNGKDNAGLPARA